MGFSCCLGFLSARAGRVTQSRARMRRRRDLVFIAERILVEAFAVRPPAVGPRFFFPMCPNARHLWHLSFFLVDERGRIGFCSFPPIRDETADGWGTQ